MKELKLAKSIRPELCSCGCGHVYVYLCDDRGRDYARFTLSNSDWVPFGEECQRISRGEMALGQPAHEALQ